MYKLWLSDKLIRYYKKTEEMTSNMRKYNISICGIQEHRKVYSADREQDINRYDVDPGYDLYTLSVWINQVPAANGGVGIIIITEESKRGNLWTWMSPHMTKHQLYYILVRKNGGKT